LAILDLKSRKVEKGTHFWCHESNSWAEIARGTTSLWEVLP